LELLHIVRSVLEEVVPGLVKGRAAGEDVVDVIHGVRAKVREKTNSSLVLGPVTANSFSPIPS
jgi:hypothetical protein